jgi:ribonuclease HI
MEPDLIAYCDGSGTVAHLPCGAGVVVYDGGEVVLEASRSLGLGTNNHAELSAIRVALAITDTPEWRGRMLVVRSDSMYAIGAMTAPRNPAPDRPNARLIAITRRLLAGRSVRFEHVKGHSSEPGNERADKLAGLARLRGVAALESSGGSLRGA